MVNSLNLQKITLLAATILLMGISFAAKADLAAYLARPEPAYRWEKTGEKQQDGVTITDLHLVSQVWHKIKWEHHLQIFRPSKLAYPHFCTMRNMGGDGGPEWEQVGTLVAKGSGAIYACVYNNPNQPLYDGRTEDSLIVYTWDRFLQTGDETWPLHFPMCKAVIKAMDAVQAYTKQEGLPLLTDFMVTGESKRGWTTWLAGASQDKRIKAIAPMVIDTLNVAKQMPHQLEAFSGTPSEQVGDYTAANMAHKLQTPRGKRLLEIEDPINYKDILTLPKLLVLGTNDRYWAQDALNLYWDDLKGPKWVSYTPNSGHGLEDRMHVFGTMVAYIDSIASKRPLPKMKWQYSEVTNGVDLFVGSNVTGTSARLYRCFAPTQDFRDSKWTSEPMIEGAGGFKGHFDTPATGFAAIFGEVTYAMNGKTFTLSTQMHILGKK